MHWLISCFLILLSGWSLATQICVFLGWSLRNLILLAPFLTVALIGLYLLLPRTKYTNTDEVAAAFNNKYKPADKLIAKFASAALLILPISIYWSWGVFWGLTTLLLGLCLLTCDEPVAADYSGLGPEYKKSRYLIIPLLAIVVVALSYAISRSDLDDAFYVAIAAFSSANPDHAVLSSDPMLGERNFPLIFPSYRFASFELLSGALAYLLSTPAMDIYYVYLLPFWVVASVISVLLLTREIIPKYWISAGVLTFLLTILLGEMHRSPANFSFVRIFQGKAVFLSVTVPLIYYLTARFFSRRGTVADLFLLASCQVVSVGLTNFGMLAGPVSALGALLSNLPLAFKKDRWKIYSALAVLMIPLPYLIQVALQSKGSPIANFEVETPANVWRSVFGSHQQYLVGFLLVAGPVLAKDTITRWRLAIPAFLFFAIYLNPWLSDLISKYITTPPVYWRVVWSFPSMVFAAISICIIVERTVELAYSRVYLALICAVVLGSILYAAPFNTLRPDNIGPVNSFAALKVSPEDIAVARRAVAISHGDGRLLAPDEIAGLISRFEYHPRLVSTRGVYLDLVRPAIGDDAYKERRTLYDFITGNDRQEIGLVGSALHSLDVSVIVMSRSNTSPRAVRILESEAYKQLEPAHGYLFWVR